LVQLDAKHYLGEVPFGHTSRFRLKTPPLAHAGENNPSTDDDGDYCCQCWKETRTILGFGDGTKDGIKDGTAEGTRDKRTGDGIVEGTDEGTAVGLIEGATPFDQQLIF
jgi:hypothetical protein